MCVSLDESIIPLFLLKCWAKNDDKLVYLVRGELVDLATKHCVPCEGEDPPLTNTEEEKFKKEVPDWELLRNGKHKVKRQFKFKNFRESLAFVNKVSEIAESEGHHPDIYIFYNKVNLELFTHAVGGLSENDFIMAAKIDKI